MEDQVNIGLNKWVDRSFVTLKALKPLFTKDFKNNQIDTLLQTKHPEISLHNLQTNPFVMLRRNIKDVKVRNLQYKMLHNIYPTMNHLKKWGIKDTENCNLSNIKETLKHATFDCPIARGAIGVLETEINERYFGNHERVTLSYEDITLGIGSTLSMPDLRKIQIVAVDTIIIELKQKLILQREQKFNLNREDIKKLFIERKNLDKYNGMKTRKLVNLNIKWGM